MPREPDADVLITKASFVGPEACVILVRRSAEELRLAPVILNFLIESELTLGWTAIRPHLLSGDPVRVNRALRLADHGDCQEHPEYIVRLGEILNWGKYQMPSGAFALSDSEQKRRWAFSSAIDIAQERIWRFLETEQPIPRELEPALDGMLLGLEDELRYLLTEDVEYLEEEGVDVSAEIADLNERRRLVLL